MHFILDSSLAIPCLPLRVVGYSFLHWLNPLLVSELFHFFRLVSVEESVQIFLSRVQEVVNQIRAFGDTMEEKTVVAKEKSNFMGLQRTH